MKKAFTFIGQTILVIVKWTATYIKALCDTTITLIETTKIN